MLRILVPTDFSEASLAAVRYGLELATHTGGVVLLLHVVEKVPVQSYAVGGILPLPRDYIDPGGEYFRFPLGQTLIRRDFYEEARWKLDALIPPSCQDRVRTIVTVGRPADEIVRVAQDQKADLILLGTRGRRGWRRLLRTTVADRVKWKASIPVMTLDSDDHRQGRQPGHGGAMANRAEPFHTGKEMDSSPSFPSLAAISHPGAEVSNGPEHHTLPRSAIPDEPGACQAHKPARVSRA